MRLSTDYDDEVPFPKKPSGGYEWWYFDAISSDGKWSFVIIFYLGNPFSPEYIRQTDQKKSSPVNFPAISVSLYNNYSTEFYSFLEYDKTELNWDIDQEEFKVGSNSFRREKQDGKWIYHITIDQILRSKHSLKAELTFTSGPNNLVLQKEHHEEVTHIWNLLQPVADVTGKFEVSGKTKVEKNSFSGLGYHDHNVGLEPMKNDFDDWYWGRFHFKKHTLIYYLMNRKNQNQHEAWLIDNESSEVLQKFETMEPDAFSGNVFGLFSAKKLTLKGNSTEITIQKSNILDNGPFYQRFAAQAIMKQGESIETSGGISEYIKPASIYRKMFWPLIQMRLRYKYLKPHWVQKSKKMYEWTW